MCWPMTVAIGQGILSVRAFTQALSCRGPSRGCMRAESLAKESDLPLTLWNGLARCDAGRQEMLRVLERAAEDDDFIALLTYRGSEALRDHDITLEEKAALLSGDIRWIEARVGRLSARLRTWPECRLQQEIW